MKTNWLILVAASVLFFMTSCGSKSDHTITLDKAAYTVEEVIKVDFTADANWGNHAWIGVVPSSIAHGEEAVNDQHDLSYKYLEHKTGGTLEFKAPSKPGKYDMRMHNCDVPGKDKKECKEIHSVSFTVE